TWKTDFAISRPTVVVVCMFWLLRIMGRLNSAHFDGTLVPGRSRPQHQERRSGNRGTQLTVANLHLPLAQSTVESSRRVCMKLSNRFRPIFADHSRSICWVVSH